MNCLYCQKICHQEQPVYFDGGGKAYDHFFCSTCPVIIDYYTNDDLTIQDMRLSFNDDKGNAYRIFCNMIDNFCTIQYQKFVDGQRKISEIELDFIPTWDPITIAEKVKLYLTFS